MECLSSWLAECLLFSVMPSAQEKAENPGHKRDLLITGATSILTGQECLLQFHERKKKRDQYPHGCLDSKVHSMMKRHHEFLSIGVNKMLQLDFVQLRFFAFYCCKVSLEFHGYFKQSPERDVGYFIGT